MTDPSGAQWCAQFPGSHDLGDLAEPFQTGAKAFIAEVQHAGATVHLSATYRPPQRAYLMHWAWEIARKGFDPAAVPAMDGVEIQWDHPDAGAAAEAMVEGFGLKVEAVLASRHTERHAVDMTINWAGVIHVKDKRGIEHAVSRQEDLWPIGASFGLIKLPRDAPHWSNDGH